jgi:hypothetical protein
VTALNTPGRVKRKIREAIVEVLKTGNTLAGDNVVLSRATSTDADDLPQIAVYSISEGVELFDQSPKRYQRNMEVLIECAVAGDDDSDLDQKLEDLAEKVESILEANERLGLGDVVNSLTLIGTEYSSEGEGESPIGNLALRYTVQFYLYAIENQTLPDFKEIGSKWQVGHDGPLDEDDVVIDAEDETEFEN